MLRCLASTPCSQRSNNRSNSLFDMLINVNCLVRRRLSCTVSRVRLYTTFGRYTVAASWWTWKSFEKSSDTAARDRQIIELCRLNTGTRIAIKYPRVKYRYPPPNPNACETVWLHHYCNCLSNVKVFHLTLRESICRLEGLEIAKVSRFCDLHKKAISRQASSRSQYMRYAHDVAQHIVHVTLRFLQRAMIVHSLTLLVTLPPAISRALVTVTQCNVRTVIHLVTHLNHLSIWEAPRCIYLALCFHWKVVQNRQNVSSAKHETYGRTREAMLAYSDVCLCDDRNEHAV